MGSTFSCAKMRYAMASSDSTLRKIPTWTGRDNRELLGKNNAPCGNIGKRYSIFMFCEIMGHYSDGPLYGKLRYVERDAFYVRYGIVYWLKLARAAEFAIAKTCALYSRGHQLRLSAPNATKISQLLGNSPYHRPSDFDLDSPSR